MRQVINISLPKGMVKTVEEAVKKRNYASKSEFFRDILRMWLEGRLFKELSESRKEIASGRGKTLISLKNLK